MEYAALLLASTARHLQLYFNTDLTHARTRHELEHSLAKEISHYLQLELPRLLNILYRIDVDEREVKQAMLAPTQDEVALQVARLIIKRELQKAQTRFIYGAN